MRPVSGSDVEYHDSRGTAAEPRDTRAGERRPGHLPHGTATDAPPWEGSSLDAPVVQGTYRPDVGPGGTEVDESDRALANRSRTARAPDQPSDPAGEGPAALSEPEPSDRGRR